MALTLSADPLPLRLDEGGTYRVGDSGVRLDSVVFLHNRGSSPEQIVREFPTTELEDVRAVVAYYVQHRAEVDAYIEEREREADKIKETLRREGRLLPESTAREIRRRFEELQRRGG
jgi:uncharacterized protein (DUF433 family)